MVAPVLIVGSGFAAAAVVSEFRQAGVTYQILDTSEMVTETAILGSQRSTEAFAKTRGVFGGLNVWGGGVSLLDSEFHFNQPKHDSEWNKVGAELEKQNLLNPFNVQVFNGLVDPMFKRFIRLMEKSGFKPSRHTKTNVLNYGRRAKDYLRGDVQSGIIQSISSAIKHGHSVYEVVYRTTPDFKVKRGYFSAIFSCSGPLLNAVIVSMLTEKRQFAFGDHLTYRTGTLVFPRFVLPGHLGADPRAPFGFSTFVYRNREKPSSPSLTLRFSGSPTVDFLNPNNRSNSTRPRFGLRKHLALHWLVDTGISSGQTLQIETGLTGVEAVRVTHIPPIESVAMLASADQAVDQVAESVDIDLWRDNDLRGGFDLFASTSWESAKHAYGTVPVSGQLGACTVNYRMELNGFRNMYVVGSSAFPDGAMEHPTALVVALARMAARVYAQESACSS